MNGAYLGCTLPKYTTHTVTNDTCQHQRRGEALVPYSNHRIWLSQRTHSALTGDCESWGVILTGVG